MTLQIIDGFDLYNGTGANTGLASKWSADHGTPAMVAGRFGGQAVQLPVGSNTGIIRAMPATSVFAFGVAIKISSLVGISGLPMIGSTFDGFNGKIQNTFYCTSGGILKAGRTSFYNSAPTELAASSGQVLTAGTWHYLEGEVEISDSVGRMTAWVDGVQALTVSSVDTKQQSSSTANGFFLQVATATGGNTQYDDLYVTDAATRIGERKVETLYASADTAQKDFTPSTGSDNYAMIDEAQCDGDTTYVEGSTVGDTDRYAFGNLSATPDDISAVQLTAFALKTDAASRSIALQVDSGGTISDGSNFGLATGYAKHERIMETDPNTSSAWDAAGVNAIEAGPKVTV